MRDAWRNASTSDRLIGVGGPVIGLLALVAGLASSDLLTAVFGAVALVSGLVFAIPLIRAGGEPGPRD